MRKWIQSITGGGAGPTTGEQKQHTPEGPAGDLVSHEAPAAKPAAALLTKTLPASEPLPAGRDHVVYLLSRDRSSYFSVIPRDILMIIRSFMGLLSNSALFLLDAADFILFYFFPFKLIVLCLCFS